MIFLGYIFRKKFNNSSLSNVLYIIPLFNLFSSSISYTTICLWIICVIYLFIGYSNDIYKLISRFALGILILSVFVNLYDFWVKIPVFVYIFAFGISIIIFVTRKEYKKSKNIDINSNDKSSVSDVVVNNENVNDKILFCNKCGFKLNGDESFCPMCGNKIK